MAMTATLQNLQASVRRRIRQFYAALNRRDFDHCRRMIDPRIRLRPGAVTLHQYENSLAQFLAEFGSVDIVEFSIALHLNEPSALYEGRDFALGRTTWVDDADERHVFSERWVRDGRAWYTRSTGFVTPVTSGQE